MTKTAWYRIVLVLIAVGLIGVLDLVMTQNQIANPFLVGGLGLTLGIVLALLVASIWQPRNSRKPCLNVMAFHPKRRLLPHALCDDRRVFFG